MMKNNLTKEKFVPNFLDYIHEDVPGGLEQDTPNPSSEVISPREKIALVSEAERLAIYPLPAGTRQEHLPPVLHHSDRVLS